MRELKGDRRRARRSWLADPGPTQGRARGDLFQRAQTIDGHHGRRTAAWVSGIVDRLCRLLAAGRLFEDGLSLHDYGASARLVREAGGEVTAFNGGPITANGDVLAGNRILHPWLVEGFQA